MGEDCGEKFSGYLFARLHLLGTKSEGPSYFLQQADDSDLPVIKKVQLWEDDPALHARLGSRVAMTGVLRLNGVEYCTVGEDAPRREAPLVPTLTVEIESNPVWVNRMPPGPHGPKSVRVSLLAHWPYRSTWRGMCPTSQTYDFSISFGGQEIWRWSNGKLFAQVFTPVEIPGPGTLRIDETWTFNQDDIEEGPYTLTGEFIATGGQAATDFDVRYAY
jgi:hypothetical protein